MGTYLELFGSVTMPLVALLAFVGAAVAAVVTATRSWGWRVMWISALALSVSAVLLVSAGVSPGNGLYVALAQLGSAMLALLSVASVATGACVIARRLSHSRPVAVTVSVAGAVLSAPLFIVVAFGVACSLGECS
jgi:hypothetical protein